MRAQLEIESENSIVDTSQHGFNAADLFSKNEFRHGVTNNTKMDLSILPSLALTDDKQQDQKTSQEKQMGMMDQMQAQTIQYQMQIEAQKKEAERLRLKLKQGLQIEFVVVKDSNPQPLAKTDSPQKEKTAEQLKDEQKAETMRAQTTADAQKQLAERWKILAAAQTKILQEIMSGNYPKTPNYPTQTNAERC